VLAVSILIAVMGHILFGDFESTMATLPASISGDLLLGLRLCPHNKPLSNGSCPQPAWLPLLLGTP